MRLMILNCVKLGRAVTFTYISLIFLAKTLIYKKITFPASNSLNLAELVVDEPMRSIYKKITNIPFSIRFITV